MSHFSIVVKREGFAVWMAIAVYFAHKVAAYLARFDVELTRDNTHFSAINAAIL